jgi:ATP-dependent exoDNAse (exonuclease V) beta subunit
VEVEQAQQLGCWPALAVSAREAYRAARHSRAVLDFDDLVLRARELLSRDDIRRHYRRHFRAILVDEHQDTDPVQHEILELLAGPALSGHPGEDDARWFIVGDSQQSIYGFRGADVVSFQRLVETAQGWDGHRTLKKNYRSRSELLAFFNDFFPEVLKRGTALYEIDYMEQESERTPVGWASVEYLDPAGLPPKVATPELRRIEAEALAARLWAACDPQHPARIEIIDGGGARVARPGDIVVLLRKLTASELYRQALQRVGFDVVVAGGGQFYQRQEVFDCLHALEAALHAEDPIPLVAYLRSPMVGLPDEAIWRALRGADGRSGTRIRAWLARDEWRGELDAEHRSRLAEGLAVLDELASRADSEPPAATLAWLIDRTGYASVLDALPDRSQRRANVERLIAGADRASVQGGGLLGNWVAALRRRVETPPRQHDAAPPASESQIRIMTIHQAKGLEFPVVAVADIGGNPGQDFPRIAFHEEFGVVSQLWDDVAEDFIDSRTYMLAREANDRAERAEEMRLLYVAATRAREHLVLSAAARTGSRDRRWLAVFEPWSRIADSRVGLARLPLVEWLAAFRSSQGAERRIPPPAEPYRDPLPAGPGQIDARAVATALSGASEWQAVIEVRHDAAAARRAMRSGVTGHGVLERLPLPTPGGFDLPRWLEEAGIEREEIERVARFVEKVRPELERARRFEREHPFRLHLPNAVVVVGTIDVLLEDSSGDWWVWDYKFGERQERTEALHEAQLSIYALAAAAALDLTTVRGRLWHVGESEAHDFLWTQDQLVEIERRVADVAIGQYA